MLSTKMSVKTITWGWVERSRVTLYRTQNTKKTNGHCKLFQQKGTTTANQVSDASTLRQIKTDCIKIGLSGEIINNHRSHCVRLKYRRNFDHDECKSTCIGMGRKIECHS